jgi:hypothetical protein
MKKLLDSMRDSLPRYTLTQPSTGKVVTYRPFTVREEKTLLIANQTGSYEDFLSTLAEIIDNCFDLDMTCKKLPIFDIEYFFLKLRSKSIGEIVEPTIICPQTQEKIKISLNLDTIEPVHSPDHTNKILVSPNIIVQMNYPSLENAIKRSSKKTDYYDLVLECIQSIQTQKELIEANNASQEELEEFINLLTSEQYKKLINFFKTCPRLEKEIKYKTSKNTETTLILKGLRDFFQ